MFNLAPQHRVRAPRRIYSVLPHSLPNDSQFVNYGVEGQTPSVTLQGNFESAGARKSVPSLQTQTSDTPAYT